MFLGLITTLVDSHRNYLYKKILIPGSAAVAPKPMLSILRGVRSRKIVIAWLEREGQSLQYPKLNFDGPFFCQ
jgi:hypothetical protein